MGLLHFFFLFFWITFLIAHKLETTKLVESVCWSKVAKFFCLTNLLTDKIFQPTKHNPDELNTRVPDHAVSKSHTHISKRVTNNEFLFYVITYQKQLNKIQQLRLDCRLKSQSAIADWNLSIFQEHLRF